MFVELADQRVGRGRVEVRSGQLVQRRHDADVGDVRVVAGAQLLGQVLQVARADIGGSGRPRDYEREFGGRDPLGQQADLGVAEQQGRRHPVDEHGGRRDPGAGHPGAAEQRTGGQAERRAEGDLLRPDAEQSAQSAGGRRDRARPGAAPLGGPAQRCDQRRTDRDALEQRRELAGSLPVPGDRLGRGERDRPDSRSGHRVPEAAGGGQCGPGGGADAGGESESPEEGAGRRTRGGHRLNLDRLGAPNQGDIAEPNLHHKADTMSVSCCFA